MNRFGRRRYPVDGQEVELASVVFIESVAEEADGVLLVGNPLSQCLVIFTGAKIHCVKNAAGLVVSDQLIRGDFVLYRHQAERLVDHVGQQDR